MPPHQAKRRWVLALEFERMRTLSVSMSKHDWNAAFYVTIGGDAIVDAPTDGWPEDVALSLTDAPEAALTCDVAVPGAIQSALSSEAALAVAWDDFRSPL